MSHKKILLVEDEKALRDLLKKLLERSGFSVVVASNGDQALQIFKKGAINLIVTDLRMPVKGGGEMLREMEGINPSPPVVIITGYPLEPEIQEKVNAGRYHHFSKPFDNEEVLQCVKELLG